jgi:hypothetical protein
VNVTCPLTAELNQQARTAEFQSVTLPNNYQKDYVWVNTNFHSPCQKNASRGAGIQHTLDSPMVMVIANMVIFLPKRKYFITRIGSMSERNLDPKGFAIPGSPF